MRSVFENEAGTGEAGLLGHVSLGSITLGLCWRLPWRHLGGTNPNVARSLVGCIAGISRVWLWLRAKQGVWEALLALSGQQPAVEMG